MEILVACPHNYITGGIELIHQLVHELNGYSGICAKVWYIGSNISNPQPKEYDCYGNEYVVEQIPSCDSFLIFPEIWADMTCSQSFAKHKKAIYWMSVDNYVSRSSGRKLSSDILHITQSYYAYDYLTRVRGIEKSKIFMLTDYLNKAFLNSYDEDDERGDLILYNPKKGMEFTQKIIDAMPYIEGCFVPLQDMSREQLLHLMRKAKLYIDFGNHPGKDRLPRECAVNGCCVITSKNGSAKFHEDVTIPDDYKFDAIDENIPNILNKIEAILADYSHFCDDFAPYRGRIRKEPVLFKQQVESFVNAIYQPRFSIIIPAHDSAKYIAKALTSIRQQVFKDYELIVVCDSCNDNTAEIAMSYNAKLVITDFHCDGPARSVGLDKAKGEYVLFMDDDDWWLHEYVLNQLDDRLKKEKEPDILCFSFIFKGWKYADPKGNGGNYWIACWNKCWKKSFIGDSRFPNKKMSSDVDFHYSVFSKNPKIVEWDMPMYYYNYMREGSQTERDRRK